MKLFRFTFFFVCVLIPSLLVMCARDCVNFSCLCGWKQPPPHAFPPLFGRALSFRCVGVWVGRGFALLPARVCAGRWGDDVLFFPLCVLSESMLRIVCGDVAHFFFLSLSRLFSFRLFV